MMLFFTKSDTHNCLNCILFYAFNYVKSTKVSCQYFTATVENIVSYFILIQDVYKPAFKAMTQTNSTQANDNITGVVDQQALGARN